MYDRTRTYGTCKGCGWYLAISHEIGTRRYCATCEAHAHLLPITSDGVASVRLVRA